MEEPCPADQFVRLSSRHFAVCVSMTCNIVGRFMIGTGSYSIADIMWYC